MSGFLDGTALATVAGRCWRAMALSVEGFHPVPEQHVVLAGARDLDKAERAVLEVSPVTVLSPSVLHEGEALALVLGAMAQRVRGVYLHLDPDVIDPGYGCANSYAPPGGISPAEVLQAMEEVKRQVIICALGVASYDPAADVTGAISQLLIDVITAAVPAAAGAA